MSGAATPRPSSGRTAVLVLVAACTGALASPAAAQTVSGRILDGDSREPITGAQVVLVDEAGLDRGAVLTGQDGRFRLRAPA
ncbi:MAG: carboxypeptidase-like regulatory domain-containing protein, partial [Gemmatimonadetes bacterium]|nr:carboxypeptidase-like regulatory domain-containing protein [Gemmatimonadota bacterium]